MSLRDERKLVNDAIVLQHATDRGYHAAPADRGPHRTPKINLIRYKAAATHEIETILREADVEI